MSWTISSLRIVFIPASTNNLAYRKQATQSSDWSSTYIPSKAVDGDTYTYSCTRKQHDNYWTVDMGMDINVDHLYIKNRYASSEGELYISRVLNDFAKI